MILPYLSLRILRFVVLNKKIVYADYIIEYLCKTRPLFAKYRPGEKNMAGNPESPLPAAQICGIIIKLYLSRMQRYRSGRNEADSKSVDGSNRPGVRIPPSPPFAGSGYPLSAFSLRRLYFRCMNEHLTHNICGFLL